MCCARRSKGLPRLGGGVSPRLRNRPRSAESSPPRRGCFRLFTVACPSRLVFPASTGVFLIDVATRPYRRGLPRLGGGVSMSSEQYSKLAKSSPPRRGCFLPSEVYDSLYTVFPASAGVFPLRVIVSRVIASLPRLGGGVSAAFPQFDIGRKSSPPRRGCFCRCADSSCQARVFPASAGVFLFA